MDFKKEQEKIHLIAQTLITVMLIGGVTYTSMLQIPTPDFMIYLTTLSVGFWFGERTGTYKKNTIERVEDGKHKTV